MSGLSGSAYSRCVRCIVIRGVSDEKPISMSFLGFKDRCQYRQLATGLGSTTPAVYAACHTPHRLTCHGTGMDGGGGGGHNIRMV